MTHFANIPAPLTHQSDGHRHAWEALDCLGRGLMDVCSWYSQPSFHLTHCLIVPDQAKVREARDHFAQGIALLQHSLRQPS